MERQEKKEIITCIRRCINRDIFSKFILLFNFTEKEQKVLKLLNKQYSFEEIADEMNYSSRQIQRIIDKISLQIHNAIMKYDNQTSDIKEIIETIFL